MSFRNPITSLPASAITGPINAASLETADSGNRVVIQSDGTQGEVLFYSGNPDEAAPGVIASQVSRDEGIATTSLRMSAPTLVGGEGPTTLELSQHSDGTVSASVGPLSTFTTPDGTQHTTVQGDLTVVGTLGLTLLGGGGIATDMPAVVLPLVTGYSGHTPSSYDPPTFQLMADGWVRMWGRMDTPSTWTSGVLVGHIADSSLWPAKSHIFSKQAVGVDDGAEITVESNGDVRIWFPTGTPTDITFTGVTWPTSRA
jgi:hypothetical protein